MDATIPKRPSPATNATITDKRIGSALRKEEEKMGNANEQGMSRRSFLGGLSASAIALGALAVTGCSAGNGNGGANVASVKWDEETDVLVVGYGGSGASAAIAAAEAGADVLIIEKAPEGDEGGNTSVSGGGAVIATDPDVAFDFLKFQMPDTVDDEEIKGFVKELAELPAWLKEHGIEPQITDVKPGGGAGAMYTALPTSAGMGQMLSVGGTGASLFKALKEVAESTAGVRVKYELAGSKLVFDPETKEVFGVIAIDAAGNAVRIRANRAVVLTCGGFENNHKMLTTYYPPMMPIYPCGTPYNTGDGIRMVQEVGAELRGFSSAEWGLHCCKPASDEVGVGCCMAWSDVNAWSHSVIVNKQGKRFVNEGAPTVSAFPTVLRPLHDKTQLPELAFSMETVDYVNLPMFVVMDSAKINNGPVFTAAGKTSGNHWANVHKWYSWSDDNQAEIQKGWLVKGDTIEELAQKLGIDPAGLVETVARYNEACASGVDGEFGRVNGLDPVAEGPFYGCELGLGIINTQGGPTRNAAHQVLDYDGKVIPRLYSGGEFGSMYVWKYQGAGNVPETMGTRVAGANAAAESPWK